MDWRFVNASSWRVWPSLAAQSPLALQVACSRMSPAFKQLASKAYVWTYLRSAATPACFFQQVKSGEIRLCKPFVENQVCFYAAIGQKEIAAELGQPVSISSHFLLLIVLNVPRWSLKLLMRKEAGRGSFG
jgi:hypothetical protein